MIDLDKINERKEVIAKDVEAVRGRLAEAQKKIAEDQALLNALMGAFQQCDVFAKEFDDGTDEDEDSSVIDVENSPEED